MYSPICLAGPPQTAVVARCLAQLDSVLGAPALCCVNGIALCVSGMGFMWRLCGSVYVRFGPLLAYAGLSWPSLAACTAGHPAETQFRKELPDRGTGTKPACDRLRGSWGRSAGAGVPSGSCRFGPAKRPASRVCGVMWPTWALCCVMLLTESSWAKRGARGAALPFGLTKAR